MELMAITESFYKGIQDVEELEVLGKVWSVNLSAFLL